MEYQYKREIMENVLRHDRDFEGLYAVSRSGEIISMKGGHGYVMKPKRDKNGIYVIFLRKRGKGYLRTVAKLVLESFVPAPSPDMVAVHKDGDHSNNSLSNLKWEKRGDVMGRNGKRVYSRDPETGEVMEFKNSAEAGRALGIEGQYILNTLNSNKKNGTKYLCHGMEFWRD